MKRRTVAEEVFLAREGKGMYGRRIASGIRDGRRGTGAEKQVEHDWCKADKMSHRFVVFRGTVGIMR